MEDDGVQDARCAVGFREDEVDVAGVWRPASVRAADGDLDGCIYLVNDGAEELAVGFYLFSRDPGLEIVVVFNADQLVFAKVGFADEIAQGAMALVDPLGCLSEAYSVYFQKPLQGQVIRFETGVF